MPESALLARPHGVPEGIVVLAVAVGEVDYFWTVAYAELQRE